MTRTTSSFEIVGQRPADTSIALAVQDPTLRKQVFEALQVLSIPVLDDNCSAADTDELVAAVQRLRPAVLILGLTGLKAEPSLVVALIAKLDVAPRIIALNDAPEPELILKTMRAGAAEFVYPPMAAPAFEEAMRRVLDDCRRDEAPERSQGAMIGFVSAKGGCGATTLVCHAARHLRSATRRQVLVADLDFASGIAGIILQAPARYSMDDALANLSRLDLRLWKAMVASSPTGLDVMPAGPGDGLSLQATRVPQLLRFMRSHYDYAMLDLGHGLTPALTESVESLDTLVLVTTNEVPALRQAKHLLHSLAARNFGGNRLRLVINRMPRRTPIPVSELETVIGHPVFATMPNDYHELNDAYSEPRLLDERAELSAAIGRMADNLTGVPAPASKPRSFFSLRRRN